MYKKIEIKINDTEDKYTQWNNKTLDLLNKWILKSDDLLIVLYWWIEIKFKITNTHSNLISLESDIPKSLFRFNKDETLLLSQFVWDLSEDNIEYYFLVK
jgi:hypothetical protein